MTVPGTNELLVCPRCGQRYEGKPLRFCGGCGEALQAVPLLAARFLGMRMDERYEVTGFVREAALSPVFRGRHLRLDKHVAIKILPSERAAQADAAERFLQEARMASMIHHPNVVDVIDYGRTPDGDIFLVEELLEGKTLAAHLAATGPMPVFESVNILRQVCRALWATHDQGMVHLDVTPENIFLSEMQGHRKVVRVVEEGGERHFVIEPEGSFHLAKLIGFSDAKATGGESGPADGRLLVVPRQTTQYTPPEQVAGRPLDARSDIYMLGILFYRMVTGMLPFDAEPMPGATVIPPGWRVPALGIDDGTNRTVMRCLEADPAARFQTMDEVLLALDTCFKDRVFLRDAACLPGAAEAGIVPPESSSVPAEAAREILSSSRSARLTEELRELFAASDDPAAGPRTRH